VRAVARPGDTIAIESPTYFGILQIIESLGMKALEIPTDPRTGISLEALDLATQKAGNVKAVIVMPSVQNPLGSVMPDANKERLVRLMEERGIAVIEDDIYGDLAFARQRPRQLKSWDESGNVMLCSSFTKNIAPGFRVGWVAAGRWQEAITHLKFTNTVSTPAIFQSAIARFMEDGGYDHHMRHLREAFQEQLRHVRETVERHFPEGTRLTRPEGGFLLWVELPKKINSIALFERAIAEKIYVAPGKLFTTSGRFDNYLRLSCGYPWSTEIERGIIRLGKLCEQMMKE
jgi:DNA-binding transcriptional MocR family regulator